MLPIKEGVDSEGNDETNKQKPRIIVKCGFLKEPMQIFISSTFLDFHFFSKFYEYLGL